jgi:hypothetical protein
MTVPGRLRRLAVRVVGLVLLVAFAAVVPTAPGSDAAVPAAPLPAGWCGPDETALDRPDTVIGSQVHVVYAVADGEPSRFAEFAPLIARDLAGVDEWWRAQDPTRTPRFDLAAFPGCDTEFGGLDISSIRLEPGADTTSSNGALVSAVERALAANGAVDTKKYLVYLDAAPPFDVCGVSRASSTRGGALIPSIVLLQGYAGCFVERVGTGDDWPAAIAAHELLHSLSDPFVRAQPPNACADASHVCDGLVDILAADPFSPSKLSQRVLDLNHDDYYAHGEARWDVQDSAWLWQLDQPAGELTVHVDGDAGGTLRIGTDAACTTTCTYRAAFSTVPVVAEAPVESVFVGWTGNCANDDSDEVARCDVGVIGPVAARADFAPAYTLRVTAGVGGRVTVTGEDEPCLAYCLVDAAAGRRTMLVARADPRYEFVRWRGACRGTGRRCVVRAPAAASREAVAVFRTES